MDAKFLQDVGEVTIAILSLAGLVMIVLCVLDVFGII